MNYPKDFWFCDVEWARFDSAGDYIDWLPQYEH